MTSGVTLGLPATNVKQIIRTEREREGPSSFYNWNKLITTRERKNYFKLIHKREKKKTIQAFLIWNPNPISALERSSINHIYPSTKIKAFPIGNHIQQSSLQGRYPDDFSYLIPLYKQTVFRTSLAVKKELTITITTHPRRKLDKWSIVGNTFINP